MQLTISEVGAITLEEFESEELTQGRAQLLEEVKGLNLKDRAQEFNDRIANSFSLAELEVIRLEASEVSRLEDEADKKKAEEAEAARIAAERANPYSSEGIDDPTLKAAYEWALSQVGQGIGYSMEYRMGPYSYDCSSYVTRALTMAGMSGVDGSTTVSMLYDSNALGQSGTKYRQVDYTTAEKGTIIVVGGLEGLGAGGHTFFLAEDYHGPDTKVLECAGGYGVVLGNTFNSQSMYYNQVVALVPA